MYSVLDKDMIEIEIVPLIPRTKRGFPPTVPLVEIVNAILYKLKTGVQWNQLPVKALFSGVSLSWQAVYHHRKVERGQLFIIHCYSFGKIQKEKQEKSLNHFNM
ncbi:transposase [Sinomicrobium sp. M5D2P9]